MVQVLNPKPKFILVQSTDSNAELMPYLRNKMAVFGCWPIKNSKKNLRWFIILMTITFNTIPTVNFIYL